MLSIKKAVYEHTSASYENVCNISKLHKHVMYYTHTHTHAHTHTHKHTHLLATEIVDYILIWYHNCFANYLQSKCTYINYVCIMIVLTGSSSPSSSLDELWQPVSFGSYVHGMNTTL